jgi:hypothetical protein
VETTRDLGKGILEGTITSGVFMLGLDWEILFGTFKGI